jgi:hypothetical protein
VITVTLILCSMVGLATPLVELPAASTPSPASAGAGERPVSLRIDHSALLQHEDEAGVEHTVFFVRDDGVKALGETSGVAVVDDPQAPAILVTLSWVSYEDSIYGVSVETQRPGEAPRLLERFECECINSGLGKAVVARLPAALEQLAEAGETAPAEPVVEEPAVETRPEPVVDHPVVDEPKRVPLQATGKAGVGLLAVGVVGVVTGGIVFAQRLRYDQSGPYAGDQARDLGRRDFGPPGVAVMIAGGLVSATGTLLLIVDRAQARSARQAAKPRAWLAPTMRGLIITGRF